jgi:DNA-binding CsgD family transcriptional regulator
MSLGIEDRRRFVRLLHRGLDLPGLFDAADRALGRVVPFDTSCWLSLDPATLLPTSHFTRQVTSDHLMDLVANEFGEDDVNKFSELARAERPVGTLREATGDHPERSPRFLNVLAPNGYGHGDELRAVFRTGATTWGCVVLHRRRGTFDASESGLVVDAGLHIGEGIRRAVIATALARNDPSEAPGLLILRGDDSTESISPAARYLLVEMLDPTAAPGGVPLTVVSVANIARRAHAGLTEEVANVRLPKRSGGWLLLHASVLEGGDPGRVGVMIYPAREPEVAQLIVEAYGLTRREQELTRLVLNGLSTREMAEDLQISTYTVQDHLKSIFAKVGVRSRRELAAQLFQRHYVEPLEAVDPRPLSPLSAG